MPVKTGLVSIYPWDTIEWVAIRSGPRPDTYRIISDQYELFTVQATEQKDLLDKINAAWRLKYPQGQ